MYEFVNMTLKPQKVTRSEVFTALKLMWSSSRFWRRVDSSIDATVSEKYSVSIFGAGVLFISVSVNSYDTSVLNLPTFRVVSRCWSFQCRHRILHVQIRQAGRWISTLWFMFCIMCQQLKNASSYKNWVPLDCRSECAWPEYKPLCIVCCNIPLPAVSKRHLAGVYDANSVSAGVHLRTQ